MTYTSPEDHALIASGGDEVDRGLVVGTRDILWQGVVSALHADSASHGIYALDLTTITGGSDPTHCYPGMTLDIGTSAGLADIGSVRIRFFNSTTTKVTIAETAPADLPVQVGHHVTARKEFLPWQIPKRIVLSYDGSGNINGVTEYLDYDLAYSSGTHPFPTKSNITAGHNRDGTPKHVLLFDWEDTPGCGYRTVHLSALDSVIHNFGATLASVLWDLQDCIYLNGGVPTDFEVDVQVPVGFRYIHLQVTDSNGKGDIFWRHMPLWCDVKAAPTMVLRNFNVTSDETELGREFQFEFFGDANEADITVIPKRSLTCYFEEPSWAGGDTPPESYRQQSLGWVTDDDPLLKLQASTYGIKVGSTQHWKQNFRVNSVTLIDTGTTPTTYTQMQHMTVDRVVDFSLIAEDSLRSLVNVYYSGVTTEVEAMTIPQGDAWSALVDLVPRAAMCAISSDRFGNIWLRQQYSFLSDWQRAIVLEAIALTNADWMDADGLELPTTNINKVGMVNGAAEYWNGGRVEFASQAPGLRSGYGVGMPKLPGQFVDLPQPQGDLNRLTGLFYWNENNPRPAVTLILFGNLDVIEPCWQQPILITWTDPTIRSTQLSATPFVIKHVSIAHTNSPDSSTPPKRITLTLEQATSGAPGETAPVVQMAGMTQPSDSACAVTAGFTDVATVCAVVFTDTSTGDLLNGWLWDFGDGGFSIEQNPTHGYATPGTYTVTLFVASECGAGDSISHNVTVTAETVVAAFTDTGIGSTFIFVDGSSANSGIASWAWDFGDGGSASVQNPTYSYSASGTFHVTLTITSVCGNTAMVTHDVVTPVSSGVHTFDFTASDGGSQWHQEGPGGAATTYVALQGWTSATYAFNNHEICAIYFDLNPPGDVGLFSVTHIEMDYIDNGFSSTTTRFLSTEKPTPPGTTEFYANAVAVFGNQTYAHDFTNSLGVVRMHFSLEHTVPVPARIVITAIRVTWLGGSDPF